MPLCDISHFVEFFKNTGKTVSCAESCTGGLIGSLITSVPGSSSVFMGGVIAYSNTVKTNLLGVPQSELKEYGAVSMPVAKSMALGAIKATGSDYSVAVTGIAGPGGAVPGKPVGTVCIGVSDGSRALASTFHFSGDRDAIRSRTVNEALAMLIEFAEGKL